VLLDRKVRRCHVMRLRPCLVHGLDGASRSKALSSQGPRAFFFSERLVGYEIFSHVPVRQLSKSR
jgi:hypothetical protein